MKLQRVTSFLWQWGWLILLGTAVAGGTAFLINHNMTPVYQAAATWLIDEPTPGEATTPVPAGTNVAMTYATLLLTEPVLAETIARLDLPVTVEQLKAQVTAVSPDNYQLLAIQVEAGSPEQAAQIANTLGTVLADQTDARSSQRFAAPLTNWQQQIDDSSAAIAELEKQLAADDVPNRTQLEANLAEAQARYDAAFAEYNALLVEQARESVALMPVEPAQPTAVPVRPRTTMATIWAAAAGALASVLIIGAAGWLGFTTDEMVVTAVSPAPVPLTSND
ncbi:MAG: hypothetical protein P8183_11845 [Anaerolineae bacterium]